jgi:hypothetical protein
MKGFLTSIKMTTCVSFAKILCARARDWRGLRDVLGSCTRTIGNEFESPLRIPTRDYRIFIAAFF